MFSKKLEKTVNIGIITIKDIKNEDKNQKLKFLDIIILYNDHFFNIEITRSQIDR